MNIFSRDHLLLDIDVKNQTEAFEAIAQKALELGVSTNAKILVADLIKREQESTTGMSDGVAIPHAMNADFTKPAVIVARFKEGVEWKAIGSKPVRVAFALLIPANSRGTLHMKYLQNIAIALLDTKFNEVILNSQSEAEIVNIITRAIERKEEPEPVKTKDSKSKAKSKEERTSKVAAAVLPHDMSTVASKGLIVGVSSCATGVAHTYMAREALEKHAKDVGYDVWIETQGQSGREHPLTEEMIQKAAAVIIASDINVELDRFIGKKIYKTNTNEAINAPTLTLEKTIKSITIEGKGTASDTTFGGGMKQGGFMRHFLNGVSHMIPFIVFSGILYAILNAVVSGGVSDAQGSAMWYALQIANVGFTLFTAVMGGYIAMSIAGRAGLAVGFMATLVAATPEWYVTYSQEWMMHAVVNTSRLQIEIKGISIGIFAAIIMGFSAGWLVNLFNKIPIHKLLKPIMPLIVIPVVCTSILAFPFMFGLSGLLGCVMDWFGAGLSIAGTNAGGRIIIGLVLGAMVGFDMGGPINKIAVATATTLIPVDPSLMGAVAAAIPIAPIGCGLAATVFGRKLFDDNEKGLGVSALALGFMGISEGAIPFAAKRLKPTVVANIIGSAIAGLLACSFYVGAHVGMWGGLIIIFCLGVYAGGGTIEYKIPSIFAHNNGLPEAAWQTILISSAWYVVAIAAAASIHALIYVILVRSEKGGGLKESIKNTFRRKKKEESVTSTTVNKFDSWYYDALIKENWYYRAKVLRKSAIIW